MKFSEQFPNPEAKNIPEFEVRREEGLALVSQLLNEGILENIGDEEAVFMLGLLHGHPEREGDIMKQLQEYKPHVRDQAELKAKVVQILASTQGKNAGPEETGQSRWTVDAETAKEHIVRLVEYFRSDPEQLNIKKVSVVPSDDLLPPQKGSSFKVNGEVIIMAHSGAWNSFDHEFLHSIINPAVENTVQQLTEEDKKRIIALASTDLKDEQGYGEYPESLLQETIIRTYTNFIQEKRVRPDKDRMAEMVRSLTQGQFEKVLAEDPLTRKQFTQLRIETLEGLRAKWEEYFDRFARNELGERIYDLLKEYESSDQPFAEFLAAKIKALIK